jgi:hypothetical protein
MWAVWFKGHIHTDAHGQLAIFASKRAANAWMKKHALPGCHVEKVLIRQSSTFSMATAATPYA